MLKMILLAGTMTIAAPALAQTTAPAGQTAPATTQTAPSSAATMTPATPMQTTPMQSAPTQTAPTQAAPADTTAAATSTAPTQSQVAQVVDQQFGIYDKDANGSLSKTEFAAWMTALKTASNSKPANPAEDTAWNEAAFKQADGDKSATVTKTELTGFLVKGASGAS